MADNNHMPEREASPIGDFNIGFLGITTALYPCSLREALATLAGWSAGFGNSRQLWNQAAPRTAVAAHASGGLNG